MRLPMYEVTGSLVNESGRAFRPRLAAAALAVQLTVPVIKVRSGLPPPSECAMTGAQTFSLFPRKGKQADYLSEKACTTINRLSFH